MRSVTAIKTSATKHPRHGHSLIQTSIMGNGAGESRCRHSHLIGGLKGLLVLLRFVRFDELPEQGILLCRKWLAATTTHSAVTISFACCCYVRWVVRVCRYRCVPVHFSGSVRTVSRTADHRRMQCEDVMHWTQKVTRITLMLIRCSTLLHVQRCLAVSSRLARPPKHNLASREQSTKRERNRKFSNGEQ